MEHALPCPGDFGPFGDRVWLNCAHQGPICQAAAAEAQEAIRWKQNPFELTQERFNEVPARLKRSLASLIHAAPDDIILGNSASYGLHLIAKGIRWRAGDEVLLMKGDFPSDVLPWLALEKCGVGVRWIESRNPVPQADEVAATISKNTRLVCLPCVHSFSGWAIDAEAIGAICHERAVRFVMNGSQGIGARAVNLGSVDALIGVGFKWLCGPYGTGFCWVDPEWRQQLDPQQSYWLSLFSASDLQGELEIKLRPTHSARAFDVFGTANFFNFKSWAAAVEYLLSKGIENIADYDQHLVSQLIDGLDASQYRVVSPSKGQARSTLVVIEHIDPGRNAAIYERLKTNGIDVAFRKGRIRLSPHLYNTAQEIDVVGHALACPRA